MNDRRALPILGLPELREEIARQQQHDLVAPFDPADEVLITHGATGALAAAIDAFVNPATKVVLL